MISSEEMLLYNVITKEMNQALGEAHYDKIITSNQVNLNQQSQITLANVAEAFFETPFNFAPKSKIYYHT